MELALSTYTSRRCFADKWRSIVPGIERTISNLALEIHLRGACYCGDVGRTGSILLRGESVFPKALHSAMEEVRHAVQDGQWDLRKFRDEFEARFRSRAGRISNYLNLAELDARRRLKQNRVLLQTARPTYRNQVFVAEVENRYTNAEWILLSELLDAAFEIDAHSYGERLTRTFPLPLGFVPPGYREALQSYSIFGPYFFELVSEQELHALIERLSN